MKRILIIILCLTCFPIYGETNDKKQLYKAGMDFLQKLHYSLIEASSKIDALKGIEKEKIHMPLGDDNFDVIVQILSFKKNTKWENLPSVIRKIPEPNGIVLSIGITNQDHRMSTTMSVPILLKSGEKLRLYYKMNAYDKEEEASIMRLIEEHIAKFLESIKDSSSVEKIGEFVTGTAQKVLEEKFLRELKESSNPEYAELIKVIEGKQPVSKEVKQAAETVTDTLKKNVDETTKSEK